jgi:hypothetical protein
MISLSKELRRALASAGELLQARGEIEKTWKSAEDSLPALIEARLQSTTELAEKRGRQRLAW